MESLENIFSERGEAVPASEATEPVAQSADQPATDQQQEEQAAPEAKSTEQPQGGQATVPHAALHAEKQKVKRYTEEVADLRKEIADRDVAWERRIAQLMEANRPPQQQQQAPDWLEDPNAATLHAVAPQLEQIQQMMMANARLIAGTKFGDDKVESAEQAFIQAVQSRSLDPADYQRVVNSPNRYAEAVKWHQRQSALAEIGDDPAAYKEKLRSELLAELQQTGGQQPSQPASPAPVMPSNLAAARNVGSRSGPAWGGPQSLADIFKR